MHITMSSTQRESHCRYCTGLWVVGELEAIKHGDVVEISFPESPQLKLQMLKVPHNRKGH